MKIDSHFDKLSSLLMFALLLFFGLSAVNSRVGARYQKRPARVVIPKGLDNGIACTMCHEIVSLVESLIVSYAEPEIIDLCEELCAQFPSSYSSLCTAVVDQYVPIIIEWIKQGVDSADICARIGLCTNSSKVLRKMPRKLFVSKKLAIPKGVDNGFACDMCTQVVSYIESLIATTAESEIISLVEELCNQFPSPYSSLCDALVESYVSQIIDWIEQGIESLDICTNIGLCTNSSKVLRKMPRKLFVSKKIAIPKSADNGLACDMCTQVVSYIESLIATTAQEEITNLVLQLCDTFPSPYSSICGVIADSSVSLIIEYLEQGIESFDICTSIGLCSTEQQIPAYYRIKNARKVN